MGYVGSHSSDIFETYDVNTPAPGATGGNAELMRRPFFSTYPWFSTINYSGNFGSSNYAGLQTNLTVRNIHGLTLNGNYTFSHALAQNTITDVRNPLLDYGNLELDTRHHFTLTGSYAIPGFKSPLQMLQGWAINASVNIMSPLPLNAVDGKSGVGGSGRGTADVAGTGRLARWTLYGSGTPFNQVLGGAQTIPCFGLSTSKLFGGSPCTVVQPGPGGPTDISNFPSACQAGAASEPNGPGGTTGVQQLAAIGCYAVGSSAIVPPAQGTFGTMSLNELRGKAFHLVNFSVTKDWKITERLTTQFRVEAFNVLNQTQYGTVGDDLGSPRSFGLSQSTPDVEHGSPVVGSGGPREMQLALRLTF